MIVWEKSHKGYGGDHVGTRFCMETVHGLVSRDRTILGGDKFAIKQIDRINVPRLLLIHGKEDLRRPNMTRARSVEGR